MNKGERIENFLTNSIDTSEEKDPIKVIISFTLTRVNFYMNLLRFTFILFRFISVLPSSYALPFLSTKTPLTRMHSVAHVKQRINAQGEARTRNESAKKRRGSMLDRRKLSWREPGAFTPLRSCRRGTGEAPERETRGGLGGLLRQRPAFGQDSGESRDTWRFASIGASQGRYLG